MLQDLVMNHESLLQELARVCESLGWSSYVIVDAGAEAIWTSKPDLLPPATFLDHEVAPDGWCFVPVSLEGDRVMGFIGAHSENTMPVLAVLESHAILLGQLLSHEQELEDMATELMSTYDQLVAMYRVSEITRSNLNLDSILYALLVEAVQLSKAKHGFIALQRESGVKYITYAWTKSESVIQVLFQEVKKWRHDLVYNMPSDLKRILPDIPVPWERCILTPIKVEGDIIALLGMLDKTTYFTAGDRKLLTALADEAGGIIERTDMQAQLVAQERMRRELEIAAEIQTGLLPTTLPQIPDIDLAARSKPANEVGGDFYDFLSAPDRPTAVVLGDVTSKGVPAALFVTVAHTILNSGFDYAETPQELLDRLNSAMYDELTQSAMFITLFIAYYDPSNRQLIAANAGHSPVLFYEARNGRCRLWEADGPPIGVLPNVLSTNQAIEIHPGDVLAVMSDGFNEMTNPAGDMFGIERLERLLEQLADQSAPEILDHFFEAVLDFAQGAPPADDLTMCVLKARSS